MSDKKDKEEIKGEGFVIKDKRSSQISALPVRVGDELGREDLEGDLAVELQIEGLVDKSPSRRG